MQTQGVQPIDWWSVKGEWVETPNRDRGGFSGVQCVSIANGSRYFVKRQSNYLFRSPRYPLGRPTLLREFRNFQKYRQLGLHTPDVVHFDMRRRGGRWEALLVTRALEGYLSLREGLISQRWNTSDRTRVLAAVLDAVTVLHRLSYKHGHLYPKEIFINDHTERPTVAFLDLELSRRYLTSSQAAASDLKRFLKAMFALGLADDEYRQIIDHYSRNRIVLPRRITDQGNQYLHCVTGQQSPSLLN